MILTFAKVSAATSAAVATNGTVVFSYPSGYSSTNVITGAGALIWSAGLQTMLTQGTGNGTFSVSYSTNITVTYLGSTSIPANTNLDFYIPVPASSTAITDSTGGTASATVTLAAITAGSTYAQADLTAIKNGLATIAAQFNLLQAAIKLANINLP